MAFLSLHCAAPEGRAKDLPDPQAELVLRLGGQEVRYPLSRLIDELETETVEIDDPYFGKKKRYRAFRVQELARLAGARDADEVLFHSHDGYLGRASLSMLQEGELWIAFWDLDAEGENFTSCVNPPHLLAQRQESRDFLQANKERFEELEASSERSDDENAFLAAYRDRQKSLDQEGTLIEGLNRLKNLGPLYPIFLPREASVDRWVAPYSVRALEFALAGPGSSFPVDADLDGPVTRGYESFRQICSHCHSINGEGGTLGPELNRPYNVTEYFDERFIVKLLENPRSVRANSKMAVTNLTAEQIDEILAYLRHMKDHK